MKSKRVRKRVEGCHADRSLSEAVVWEAFYSEDVKNFSARLKKINSRCTCTVAVNALPESRFHSLLNQ